MAFAKPSKFKERVRTSLRSTLTSPSVGSGVSAKRPLLPVGAARAGVEGCGVASSGLEPDVISHGVALRYLWLGSVVFVEVDGTKSLIADKAMGRGVPDCVR